MQRRPATGSGALLGVGAAAIAAVLFGTAYIGTAYAIRSFSPMGAAMWRGIIASALLAPALWMVSENRRPSVMSAPRLWRLIVLGLAGGLGFVVGMNTAVSMAGATLAAFAASLSPVLAAVLAPFVLRERLTAASILGFGLAILGTALLSGTDITDVGPGVLAGLFASICFAVFLLLSRRWADPYRLSAGAIALSVAATTALGLLPFELLRESAQLVPQHLRTDALLGLLWLAIVPGVVAQLFVVVSVRSVETRSSAAMLLVSPITAAILAAWLLGERMSVVEIAGAGLILVGVVGAAFINGSSTVPAMDTLQQP